MICTTPIRRPTRPSEEGFGLLAVVFLVALLMISLAIAMPKIAKQIQRDREIETMHRGKQYIRAVKMYYKKFGSYPPSADLLFKGVNNIRFLRKKYSDPTTGKEEWKPVLFGQNKAPTAMGFFGQPMGGIGACVTNPLGTSASDAATNSSTFGGTNNGSSFGATAGSSSNCGGLGLNPSSTIPTDPNASQSGTNTANPNDPNATNNSNGSSTTSSAFGQPGQTFGGAGIIGFSPNSPKQSILLYKKKDHYNEWEFVYDPRAEMMMQAPGANQGLTPLQPGAPGFSPPGSGTGFSSTGDGTGTGSGSGGTGGDNGGTSANPQQWSPNGNLPAPQ